MDVVGSKDERGTEGRRQDVEVVDFVHKPTTEVTSFVWWISHFAKNAFLSQDCCEVNSSSIQACHMRLLHTL